MPPEKDAALAGAVPRRAEDVRPDANAGELFAQAVAIMARLRAPGGCPWDREQTFASIRKYTLEETWEVLDAIEREHWADLADELGDLLLQVLFYAEMADEAGHFGIADVIANLNRKLVRRHPHVFGEEASAAAGNRAEGLETHGIGAGEVLRNWDEIKKRERNPRAESAALLDSVSRAMPALSEAGKIGSKAAKVGFDWPDVRGVVEKLREECGELEMELHNGDAKAAEEEMGDLLFTLANLARHMKIDPELALRDANAKFRRRFAGMEAAAPRPLDQLSPAELENLWVRSKEAERPDEYGDTMSTETAPGTMQTTFRTPAGTEVVLRKCEGFEELDACVRIQTDTWGYDETDVIPRRLFTVAQRIGGQVVGALIAEEMVGFAMSLPGVKAANAGPLPYLHSHMLAVKPHYRNAGIGRRLKLYQRDEALSRGITLMEWTFDPLEIKNAFLNIHKLGVIVKSYTPNFYGVSSSRLQGGLPTDRLHAEWWMASERVKAVLNGSSYTPPEIQETIVVPQSVSQWKASATGVSRAMEVQAENRHRFLDAFARGLAVVGFRVDAEGNGAFELTRLENIGAL